jgi:subtilisin family serine protease
LPEDFKIQDPLKRSAVARSLVRQGFKPFPKTDNLPIPDLPTSAQGADPMLKNQWGMLSIGVQEAWTVTTGRPDMIVAVIDSGVDYTHEDLLPNIWRNPKEIANNGVDDDGNGYIDDVIGWDFFSNDNKPYDLAVDPMELLTKGGNPGHGTHCAGNVAAKGNNGLGISGVAPNVKIMPLRFISDKGSGTTADAIRAIHYAVDNGAKILSNSWGSEGEDPAEDAENKALREAVVYAQNHGVLFLAAAGNGHKGKGYDNDSDPAPGYPASYPYENIVSVAAIDIKDNLAGFSNWGLKSVHLGAPGVDIFSTTVGGNYSNFVINVGGFEITWDGTSMATPHVAGAAALYWSAHPEKNWQDVKQALLASTHKIPSLQGKTVSGGKLDVRALLK